MEHVNDVTTLLWDYGPYAVLALFALWLAPRRTQVFMACSDAPAAKLKLRVCASIALTCWAVVGVMVWCIYSNWSPSRTFVGTLGVFGQNAEFIPTDGDIYISVDGNRDQGLANLIWKYAVVVDRSAKNLGDKQFLFRYYWKPHSPENNLYALKLSQLEQRSVNFKADKNDPSKLLWDDDGDPKTLPVPYPVVASTQAGTSHFADGLFISTAHAEERMLDAARAQTLLNALDSSNRFFQAQAQDRLRTLSPTDLQRLLSEPALTSGARQQIDHELQKR